jgi:hypothetical protein
MMMMLMRLLVAMLSSLFLLAAPVVAGELNSLKSSASGVTVSVTPIAIKSDAEFKVVLDTHSQELNDDLIKTAVLLDATGNRYAASSWTGAQPGGHHREGVLRFSGIRETAWLELQISRAGEQKPRTFRWQLR